MKRIGGALCGAALLTLVGIAADAATTGYASLQLSPDVVTIHPQARVGQLFMSSLDARPAVFQVEAFAWRQDGGTDHLTPAPDVVIAPAVYDVQPYERESVRVAVRDAAFGETERAYQLRFREVRQSDASVPSRDFTVPMFLSPRAHSGTVAYELHSRGARGAELIVRNTSNEHVQLRSLEIVQGDKNCYSASPKEYVLAESTRILSLPLNCDLQNGAARGVVSDGSGQTSIDVSVR